MAGKRKKGQGTIRLRKDGRWEGRVVVGYDAVGNPKTGTGWTTGLRTTQSRSSARPPS